MLFYKSWLDTRWRFLIGLAVFLLSGCGIVFAYDEVQALLGALDQFPAPEGLITRSIDAALEAQRTYRGYVWSQWFGKNLQTLAVIFAALLGSGSPISSAGRGVLFSLSLPVTRARWLVAHASVGLGEFLALALVSSLAVAWLSPLVGEDYRVIEALVHGFSVFVVGSVFFSGALLLSTIFSDLWRPLLLTCLAAVALGLLEAAAGAEFGLFAVMSAEDYFRDGRPPWAGWGLSAAVTVALLYAAVAHLARRDF